MEKNIERADKYYKIEDYTVKCRLYPNKEQAQKIDEIIHGVHVAYNQTLYECKVNHKNTKLGKDGTEWPDFNRMMKKEWLDELKEMRPCVEKVPATALSGQVCGFSADMKKSWKDSTSDKDKAGLPVEKWKPTYYSKKKPRRSYRQQIYLSGITPSENPKVLFVRLINVGIVKARGFNNELRFDESCQMDFGEYVQLHKKEQRMVTVSKDNCGDYWISIGLKNVYKKIKDVTTDFREVGIDVGIKDIIITSDGEKFENKRFKNGVDKEIQKHRKYLQRKLTREWGYANEDFRKEFKKDRTLTPSKSYMETKTKLGKLERDVARKRSCYNHYITTKVIKDYAFIGVETLNVKGMFRNKHLANALSDAAMGEILARLKYKSEWYGRINQPIGRWTPSSKECHCCGYKNTELKLSDRRWVCPQCGEEHDRDINAAINIREYAKKEYLK